MSLVIEGPTPTLQITKSKCLSLSEQLGMQDFPENLFLIFNDQGKALCCREESRHFADHSICGLVVVAEENDAKILASRFGFVHVDPAAFNEARGLAKEKGLDCLFLCDGTLPNGDLHIVEAHWVA